MAPSTKIVFKNIQRIQIDDENQNRKDSHTECHDLEVIATLKKAIKCFADAFNAWLRNPSDRILSKAPAATLACPVGMLAMQS